MTDVAQEDANLLDAESFWESKYRNPVLFGVTAFIFLIAAAAWWRISIALRHHQAVQAWDVATTPEQKQKATVDFTGTPIIAIALLQLADEQTAKKDWVAAQKSYQQFLAHYPQHLLINAARLGLAGTLEAQNKTKEALEVYLQVAHHKPKDSYAPLAYLASARLHLASQDTAQARQLLEDGSAQFGKTPYAADFQEKIGQLPKPN